MIARNWSRKSLQLDVNWGPSWKRIRNWKMYVNQWCEKGGDNLVLPCSSWTTYKNLDIDRGCGGRGVGGFKQTKIWFITSFYYAWLPVDCFGIIKGCQKLAEEILDLRKQMEEDAGLKQKLDEELEAVKGKFVFSHSNKYTFVQQTNVCLLVCLFV